MPINKIKMSTFRIYKQLVEKFTPYAFCVDCNGVLRKKDSHVLSTGRHVHQGTCLAEYLDENDQPTVNCVDCAKSIPYNKALSLSGGLYACSDQCRDAYLANLPEEQFPTGKVSKKRVIEMPSALETAAIA